MFDDVDRIFKVDQRVEAVPGRILHLNFRMRFAKGAFLLVFREFPNATSHLAMGFGKLLRSIMPVSNTAPSAKTILIEATVL
jgi:hypothetical protein